MLSISKKAKKAFNTLIETGITPNVRADRLLVLADYLEKVRDRSFNMYHWRCGTTACAIGHACNIPEFKGAGLRISDNDLRVEFKDLDGFNAVQKFFGLNEKLSLWLFDPTSYTSRTRHNVIHRIRNVISYCEDLRKILLLK